MENLRIAVVGGGIGGLAATVALRRRGFDAHVYEQAAELKEFGAGLNISPNGVKTLRALGLEAGLPEIGFEPDSIVARHCQTAEVLYARPIKGAAEARYGAKYYVAHRADLLDLLRRALPESSIHLNARCVGVDQNATAVTLQFADGENLQADVVVAADGIRSVLRRDVIANVAPQFTGNMCYRALVPTSAVPAEYLSSEATVWVAPEGHTVAYFVSGGRKINVIAAFHDDFWTDESWSVPSSVDELMDAISTYDIRIRKIVEQAPSVSKWGVFDLPALPVWTAGRVALLGDAAHAMIPMHAQGANMALEDAVVLAAWLDANREDPVAALKSYEAVRKPRTARQQCFARSELDSLEEAAKVLNGRPHAQPQGPPPDVDWLYDYDPVTDWRGGVRAPE